MSRALRYAAPRGEGDCGGFQDFASAGAEISSLADVAFNSPIAGLANANAQNYPYLVFLIQAARQCQKIPLSVSKC